jgi:hypothetical protein
MATKSESVAVSPTSTSSSTIEGTTGIKKTDRMVSILRRMNEFCDMRDIVPIIRSYTVYDARLLFRYQVSSPSPPSSVQSDKAEYAMIAVSPILGTSSILGHVMVDEWKEQTGARLLLKDQLTTSYAIAIDGEMVYALTSPQTIPRLMIWNSETNEVSYVMLPNNWNIGRPHDYTATVIDHYYVIMTNRTTKSSHDAGVMAYNLLTNEWMRHPHIPQSPYTIRLWSPTPHSTVRSPIYPFSIMTSKGLWLRVLTNDNTFHCYNIHNRKHSILQMNQKLQGDGQYPEPNKIIEIGHTGVLLLVTWMIRPLFQLYDPSTSALLQLKWTDFTLPVMNEVYTDFDITCFHMRDGDGRVDDHYICIGNGFIHSSESPITSRGVISPSRERNTRWWISPVLFGATETTIKRHRSIYSKHAGVVGAWKELVLPHHSSSLSFMSVIDEYI